MYDDGHDGSSLMMRGIREFLNSPIGKALSAVLVLAGLAWVFISVRDNFGGSEAAQVSTAEITFIDANTGKTFGVIPYAGMTIPVEAPTGSKTGYVAELCYWTADGKIKKDPTYVLLNQYKSPASKDPTFCPDCGRLVTVRNPSASASDPPPPTQSEWKSKRGGE